MCIIVHPHLNPLPSRERRGKLDSPIESGNDKKDAEMAELVNLRFIDYSDARKITQILLYRRNLVDPEPKVRGKSDSTIFRKP